jgi:hypothetical protein
MGELLRLESELRGMPLNAPDRLLVLRRLAEGYAELEMLAERERARASAAAEAAEKLSKDTPQKPPPARRERGTGTLL